MERRPRVVVFIGGALLTTLVSAACGSATSPAAPNAPATIPGATCSVTVPQDQLARTVGPEALTLSLTVTIGAGCAWTVTTSGDFIRITAGANSSGPGTVDIALAQNTGAQRQGTITVGGVTVTVTQQGAPASPAPAACAFSVTPSNLSVPASGGSALMTVTVTGHRLCVGGDLGQ